MTSQKHTDFISTWTAAAKDLGLIIRPLFSIMGDNGQTVHCVEPRNYHTTITDSVYPINFSEINKSTKFNETNKKYSPNKAYYFCINSIENGNESDDLAGSGDGTFVVYIYNEKKLIKMETKYYKNFGGSLYDSFWVNEKLIFIRWWLGRIAGRDMIYDVEAEKIISIDEINDGELIFRDYQNHKNIKNK